jgi:hypothetical protein
LRKVWNVTHSYPARSRNGKPVAVVQVRSFPVHAPAVREDRCVLVDGAERRGGWNMYGTLSIADVANEYTLQARAAVVVRSEDCTVDMWTTGSWGVVIDPMSSGR